MDNLQKLLEEMGLNHFESRVYLLLLENGPSSVSKLALQLQSPRSTIRSILDQLCVKKLVNKILTNRTHIYSCEKTDTLELLVKDKITQQTELLGKLQQSLPYFEALWGQKSYIPEVKFFDGIEGIIEAFNFSLHTSSKEVLSITSYRFFNNPKLKKNDDNYYIPTRIKKGIKIRILTNDTAGAKHSMATAKGKLREHRILPQGFPLQGNIHIHGEYVTFYSGHDKESMAVLIKSKIFSDTLRALFEFAWIHAV